MIPIAIQPEPTGFNAAVRKRGQSWLLTKQIDPGKPAPPEMELPPYWRACLSDLHAAYGGVCAYLCVFIERCTGGSSVDHYVAKSRNAGLVYEWSNYRLACTTMNSRKRDYATVLDPFKMLSGTFHLELVTGRIYPNPKLPTSARTRAQQTIDRLGLDDGACREIRARRFSDYVETRRSSRNSAVEAQFKRYSPFLAAEAQRQGVL